MSKFKLSNRSLERLEGVDPLLVLVTKRAIELTEVDFGVTEGLRSIERQEMLVSEGKSQTMKSKHLSGKAIDVVAYNGSRVSWELDDYFAIAEAFREACVELEVSMRWGAAWTIDNIQYFEGSMKQAHKAYVKERMSEGRKPFIDAPHFELTR